MQDYNSKNGNVTFGGRIKLNTNDYDINIDNNSYIKHFEQKPDLSSDNCPSKLVVVDRCSRQTVSGVGGSSRMAVVSMNVFMSENASQS